MSLEAFKAHTKHFWPSSIPPPPTDTPADSLPPHSHPVHGACMALAVLQEPEDDAVHALRRAARAKTIASIFLDTAESSSFTTSSVQPDCCSDILSTASEQSATGGDTAADAVMRGLLSSDRLIFHPPGASATSSILEEKAFVGGVAVAFESADPYEDFRTSMVEMVAAHGVSDWGWMEEMLGWYLRANDPDMQCAIVAAFIDVVIAIADPAGDAGSASCRSSSRKFPAVELEFAEKSEAGVLAA